MDRVVGERMTYLGPLRLHFSGSFKAKPSTVNNDPTHYNLATWDPSFQDQQGPNWNPDGDAVWSLLNCQVRCACLKNGKPVKKDDLVLKCQVTDAGPERPGRLADLDPMQQIASEIWGLEIRLCGPGGAVLFSGKFEPAAFVDFWDRAGPGEGDAGAGAAYQSVLRDVHWGEGAARSHMLSQLRDETEGLLSVKFNVDGFNADINSDEFGQGRIAGTLGPFVEGEPWHMVRGRHLMTTGKGDPDYTFFPSGSVNFCAAVVDETTRRIYLDLGNALPVTGVGGPPDTSLGSLKLSCQPQNADGTPADPVPLGEIAYQADGWYASTAGIVAMPPDRQLTKEELGALADSPLALTCQPAGAAEAVAIAEPVDGLYLRADRFVYRMNPDEIEHVQLYATRFGVPYPQARIIAFFDDLQLQGMSNLPLDIQSEDGLPIATPKSALNFPAQISTDDQGMADLPIKASDPGNPRQYIDGQVYGLRPVLEETLGVGGEYPFNPWDFVSVLVWNKFEPQDDPPTWHGSIAGVFQQYANLYPVIKERVVDLSDYAAVTEPRVRAMIIDSLSRSLLDPWYMPVTRDLSCSKRAAILQWLKAEGPNAKPLEGTPPAAQAGAQPRKNQAARAPEPGAAAALIGGKTQAGKRRRLHTTRR